MPLQTLPQARAAFEIHNSPLTENAVIGFEYGYNIQEPSRLVIWEAQYGDFINGAQVMIDEFIVSARGKWGLRPSLVLLLPHAHEGQGPDHASARPERFLQLAADTNIRVANCTTAAQFFHLLRRQAALLTRRPAAAGRADAEEPAAPSARAVDAARAGRGAFQKVIRDVEAERAAPSDPPAAVLQRQGLRRPGRRGAARGAHGRGHLPRRAALSGAHGASCAPRSSSIRTPSEIVWVQEEPENMGVWEFIRPCAVRRCRRPAGRGAWPGRAAPAPRRARPRATPSISRRWSSRPMARPASHAGRAAQSRRDADEQPLVKQ